MPYVFDNPTTVTRVEKEANVVAFGIDVTSGSVHIHAEVLADDQAGKPLPPVAEGTTTDTTSVFDTVNAALGGADALAAIVQSAQEHFATNYTVGAIAVDLATNEAFVTFTGASGDSTSHLDAIELGGVIARASEIAGGDLYALLKDSLYATYAADTGKVGVVA